MDGNDTEQNEEFDQPVALPKKGKDPKEDLVTKVHTCFQRKNDLQWLKFPCCDLKWGS